MAMGMRNGQRQRPLWVAGKDLPESPGHPFYRRLNGILTRCSFERFVEGLCRQYYAEVMGRPSIPPGVYFRMLMVGYFEGIDSERGIAWRCADSLCLREFLGYALKEPTPDHSSVSRTRRLISLETHQEVFAWVLKVLAQEGLLEGKTIGIDATTLEANAALRSIVRREGRESYEEFLTALAKASGIQTPTRQDLARIDRDRKGKGCNKDWEHPHDPDARIAKMKDGRTRMAHKAEHAVDMQTGAIVAVTVQPADRGDTTSLYETLAEASENLGEAAQAAQPCEQAGQRGGGPGPPERLSEMVADKGCHSNDTLRDMAQIEVRTYVSEPHRGRRRWKGKSEEKAAVYANRRRIRGRRGKELLRKRGELVERTFAHLYETGGMRRVHLRGHPNILKRLLIHAAAGNLGLIMRKVLGSGTPRGLRGAIAGAAGVCFGLARRLMANSARHLVQMLAQRGSLRDHRLWAVASPTAP